MSPSAMTMKKIAATMAAGCAAVVLSAVPGLAAQIPQEQHAAATDAPSAAGMDAKCQVMMAERDKTVADMKAADQRLDGLVVTMNAASGTEKMKGRN